MMNEIVRVFTMAVMLFNICNQSPDTRKACMSDWDVWLYPELQRAWDLRFGIETPYESENSVSKRIQPFIYKGKEFDPGRRECYNDQNT